MRFKNSANSIAAFEELIGCFNFVQLTRAVFGNIYLLSKLPRKLRLNLSFHQFFTPYPAIAVPSLRASEADMSKTKSFLPAVRGGRISSVSRIAAKECQEQSYSISDWMWKNPSLIKCRHMERRKRNLGEPQNNPELFLGYKIWTSKIGENEKRNEAIDINPFVMNYVHDRQSQLALVKSVSKRNSRSPECLFMKKEPKKILLPSLKFTEEVISCRGDPCLSSYFSTDMKKIYALGDLSINKDGKNKERRKVKKRHALPQKHGLYMPSGNKEPAFRSKPKYNWRKKQDENDLPKDLPGKSTHLWEKYVLGLISRQTAQWIANQCSTGEQRGRLINFLDEKYKIEDVEKDGAATVYKILPINDNAVSPVRKDKQTSTVAGSQNLHTDI